jgi:hypothetical protein
MTHPVDFIGRPHDFDFFVGHWNISNRRLSQRHVGSDDWDEFPSTSQAFSHLHGLVSVDENRFPTRGFSGLTLRTLDLEARRWSIHWINDRTGRLFPPVRGGFAGDRGEFYGDDEDEGRPVEARFVWIRGRDEAHWEQAFRLPGGEWETNWVMALKRVG